MSDFDKEAERERLREKYERDKQKRETTEKMSELLLQGATMTNAHCSDCNDPIFRYDGQEFCATCEKPVDRGTGEDETEESEDERENGQTDSAIQVTSPSEDARVSFGGDSEEQYSDDGGETQGVREDETSRDEPASRERDEPASREREETARRQERPPRTRIQRRESSDTVTDSVHSDRAHADADADIAAANESLIRTLRRFSERAEGCEDPQRAREYLAAAREAAETLEALRR